MEATRAGVRLGSHRPDVAVVLVQGASRGIGLAMTEALLAQHQYGRVFATCRRPDEAVDLRTLESRSKRLHVLRLDVLDQDSILTSAAAVHEMAGRLDLLVNCAGMLHGPDKLKPERRLADVDPESMDAAFRVNALGALLVAQGFELVLRASPGAKFAALSARVGSISDNRRGGWYAYRASKAALNMVVRTLAIEWARLPRPISCFALHPGTVATDLSAPFLKSMRSNRVFSAREAAMNVLGVLHSLSAEYTGGFFAYDRTHIEW